MTGEIDNAAKKSFLNRWLGWRALVLLVFVLILLSPLMYRGWRLGQVPVIDPPFDVEEFIAPLPEEENAYFGFEQANSELIDVPSADYETYKSQLEAGWSAKTEVLDRHLDNNHLALKTWRETCELDEYQASAEWSATTSPLIAVGDTRELSRLAQIQVDKLRHMDQPEEAIPWLDAHFRFAYLIRQRAISINYLVGLAVFAQAANSTIDWASHPHLSQSQIDVVLQSLIAAHRLNSTPSQIIKADYLAEISLFFFNHTSEETSWNDWVKGEPDFSFRLLPHVARNHLLFVNEQRRDRPYFLEYEIFEDVSGLSGSNTDINPEELNDLVSSAQFINPSLPRQFLNAIDRSEARYRCLLVALAAQAYFRDHGEFPADSNQLVPEYLEEVPDDLFSPSPAPLVYRREGDDAVVYSRYVNEVDDGGREVSYAEKTRSGDLLDLGFPIRHPFGHPLHAPKP